MAAFNWKALIEDLLGVAPQVISDVFADKAAAPTESKIALAGQGMLQASSVAQSIDPNDTEKIEAATAIAEGLATAVQTPPVSVPAA